MRAALVLHRQSLDTIHAQQAPRDRTPRSVKAMQACKEAWSQAFDTAKEKGHAQSKALRMACVAYKLAMPAMDTLQGIRAAIACIAQGIQLEVFDGRDGSQLLYAAQVALATVNKKAGTK